MYNMCVCANVLLVRVCVCVCVCVCVLMKWKEYIVRKIGSSYSFDVLFNTARKVEQNSVALKDVQCISRGIGTTFALQNAIKHLLSPSSRF